MTRKIESYLTKPAPVQPQDPELVMELDNLRKEAKEALETIKKRNDEFAGHCQTDTLEVETTQLDIIRNLENKIANMERMLQALKLTGEFSGQYWTELRDRLMMAETYCKSQNLIVQQNSVQDIRRMSQRIDEEIQREKVRYEQLVKEHKDLLIEESRLNS